MYNPKVSIIIPVYNGSDYVKEAIESALSQSYKNKEIIVINDGSTDENATEKAVVAFGDKIKYIHKENGGVSTALNAGIDAAQGEWISWLSHDDLYTPDKLETQIKDVKILKESNYNYERTLYYCEGGFINSLGQKINKRVKKFKSGIHKPQDALMQLFKGKPIGGCGLLIPKKMFSELGGFDENLRYMQDVFMWEKAFIAGYNLYVNDKVMSITRIHPMQTSTVGKNFGLKDRESVGLYLLKNLEGLKDSKGNSIITQYLYSCLKSNNLNTSNAVYAKIKHSLSLKELIKIILYKNYGRIRPKLKFIYYKLVFGTKR